MFLDEKHQPYSKLNLHIWIKLVLLLDHAGKEMAVANPVYGRQTKIACPFYDVHINLSLQFLKTFDSTDTCLVTHTKHTKIAQL